MAGDNRAKLIMFSRRLSIAIHSPRLKKALSLWIESEILIGSILHL